MKKKPDIIPSIVGMVGAIIAAVIGGIMVLIASGVLSLPTPSPPVLETTTATRSSEGLAELQSEVDQIRQDLEILSQAISSAQDPESIVVERQLNEFDAELSSYEERVATLEQAIMEDPEKALQVTLLNREIEDTKSRFETDLNSLRAEISRLFGLTRWFLGLMFTIALSVFGLALRDLTGRRPSKRQGDE